MHDRITEVIKQIIKGNTTSRNLVRFIQENYDLGKDQADKDIKAARDYLKTAYKEKTRDDYISEAIARLNALQFVNFELRDFREVRQIQETLNKLLGLDAPTKHEVKAGFETPKSGMMTAQEMIEFAKKNKE